MSRTVCYNELLRSYIIHSQGFLDYFAFFPFDTHAICPFAGQEVLNLTSPEIFSYNWYFQVAVEDLRSGTNLPPCLADKDLLGAPDRLMKLD